MRTELCAMIMTAQDVFEAGLALATSTCTGESRWMQVAAALAHVTLCLFNVVMESIAVAYQTSIAYL